MASAEAPVLPAPLRATLAMTATALADARRSWWIIAGAAVALHGVDAGTVGDVDVLLAEEDARALLPRLDMAVAAGAGTARFRSAVFGRWPAPPLTVELMAGFDYRDVGGVWRRVAPATREAIIVDGATLFVPAAAELAALLRGFGRPKDLARAMLLERVGAV